MQRIVGVHEQQAARREQLRVFAERFQLRRERHHPAVRVRAHDRNIVHLAGQHVARSVAAADDRGARAVNAGVRSLRAAKTEFHHDAALRRLNDAAGFRGDQRLVIDDRKQRGFHQLRFKNRRDHAHQRLAREHDRALRNRLHVAVEFERSQLREKILVEKVLTAQVFDVVVAEMQVVEVIQQLFHARHDRVMRRFGLAAIEHIERRNLVAHSAFVIAVHHGRLIEVRHHR